eukprot:2145863-Rhodomonas_salina.4
MFCCLVPVSVCAVRSVADGLGQRVWWSGLWPRDPSTVCLSAQRPGTDIDIDTRAEYWARDLAVGLCEEALGGAEEERELVSRMRGLRHHPERDPG